VLREPIEVLAPQRAIGRQPLVDLAERLRPQAIETPLRVYPSLDQPRVAQDTQVFGDCWLADVQLLDQVSDRSFSFAQQVQDATAMWFGEDVEGERHDS
jgi:hypothetical protein